MTQKEHGVETGELIDWLTGYLEMEDWQDFPNACNGLQVEGPAKISKVGAAVDACEATMQMAVESGCDLLLVHHGLFWGGLAPVRGAMYRKLRQAMENQLGVFSAHLPLDAHPEVGNNAVLARHLGMPQGKPFLSLMGKPAGICADWEIALPELLERIQEAVGQTPHVAPGGPGHCRKVGIVTGGAGGEIHAAAAEGIDTFVTGEGPHWSFTAAEELGINLIYAGHYATETFGVRALAGKIQSEFGINWEFFDHPSGL